MEHPTPDDLTILGTLVKCSLAIFPFLGMFYQSPILEVGGLRPSQVEIASSVIFGTKLFLRLSCVQNIT